MTGFDLTLREEMSAAVWHEAKSAQWTGPGRARSIAGWFCRAPGLSRWGLVAGMLDSVDARFSPPSLGENA